MALISNIEQGMMNVEVGYFIILFMKKSNMPVSLKLSIRRSRFGNMGPIAATAIAVQYFNIRNSLFDIRYLQYSRTMDASNFI